MLRIILSILFLSLALTLFPQEKRLEKDLYGLRPIKRVHLEELPWLKSNVFLGMTLFGDTLFMSKLMPAETSPMDAEAGANKALRQKFEEPRLVMVPKFMSEKEHKIVVLGGDVNQRVNSGGLMLMRNSTSGLMPQLNYSKSKSELYYVQLDGNSIRKIRPWEGNSMVKYAFYPSFINGFKNMVFVGDDKENGKDLFFWDATKQTLTPFYYNSPADDINPFVLQDSLLFFSSDRLNKGDFDLFFFNMKTGEEPRLLFPDELKTSDDELAVSFLNDSVAVLLKRSEETYAYHRMKVDLSYAPNTYLPIPEHLLDEPVDINHKILRQHGRLAREMFLVNYGEQLTVKKPENIFLDSVPLNPYAVRIIDGVIRKENLIDVSFLLPFEIEDTTFQSETFNLDQALSVGIKKIAQLVKDLDDTHVMIIGFADAPGGEDLNLMRSYFQASSLKMQLNETFGVPETKIHMITAGEYVNVVRHDLNVKTKNNLGTVYLFRNRKAPPLLTAYKIKPTETVEIVAARFGITMSTLTYSNLLLKPFLDVPEDLMFLPVSDIIMVWKGHDMNETAEQYVKSLNALLRINALSEPIIERQKIIYIP